MGSKKKRQAGAPAPAIQPKKVAVTAKPSSPTMLSATAVPFVPNFAGYYPPAPPPQPHQVQQQYLFPQPMAYQSPYYRPGSGLYPAYVEPTHAPVKKYFANTSLIKKHNQARSQELARKYEGWMHEQHQRDYPPVSVSRKASVVLPEGDYIGYYFKPKEDVMGNSPTREMPSKLPNAMEKSVPSSSVDMVSKSSDATETAKPSTEKGPMRELIISPNDAMEFRVPIEGLIDFLPVMPLTDPILRQAQLQTDYCPEKDQSAVTKPIKQPSRFLPLIESVSEMTPTSSDTSAADDGSMKSEYYGYAMVRKEPVGYLHAHNDYT